MLTPEQRAALRVAPDAFYKACRMNVPLFNAYVQGIENGELHVELQDHLTDNDNATAMFPRKHGKTTQMCGRVAWEVGRNPNIRVQIIQSNEEDAKKTVDMIRQIIESPKYSQIFPNVRKDKTCWRGQALRVVRDQILRDNTVTAQPIGGHAGQRSDLLIFDDIEDLKNSYHQPVMREKVIEAYRETWLPTLDPGGRKWRFCTPWHHEGISWKHWKEEAQQTGEPALLYRPCIGTESSPWPERFTSEMLEAEKREMGSFAYNRAYCLVPVSGDDVVFQEDDLLRAVRNRPSEKPFTRVCAVDFAYSDKSQKIRSQRGIRADTDYTVIVIAEMTEDGHCYCVRMLRFKESLPRAQQLLLEECERYQVKRVYMEGNGPQKVVFDQTASKLSSCGINAIKKDRLTDKYTRACAVQNIVENLFFHMPANEDGDLRGEFREMVRELSQFPRGSHDDIVDCCIDLMELCRVTEAQILETPRDYMTYSQIVRDNEYDYSEDDIARGIIDIDGLDAYGRSRYYDYDEVTDG